MVDRIVGAAVRTVRALRDNELFVRIVELDPELLLPYLLSRRGRSQQAILDLLVDAAARAGRRPARSGTADPEVLARALLLTTHGFVFSAHTMVDDLASEEALDDELRGHPDQGVAAVRIRSPGRMRLPDRVDLVVVGLGVTGAGVALDAVTRGLSVLAVDAHDLAFGTSRWSSKLVHGGLRYLAHGQVGIAHESAVERRILMESTAPHLTHALPMLVPLPRVGDTGPGGRDPRRLRAPATCSDCGARTARETLPRPRHVSATEALSLAPCLRVDGLRGGLLGWDGQLEDDARLVVTIARTAASYGAHVRTRARVLAPTGRGVRLRDELTGGRDRGRRADGRQRRRRVGRRPRRRPPAAQPRHPPRAPRRVAARAAGLRDGAGAGQHQPLRDGAAPARRHRLRRPHRRAGRRAGARRARAVGGRDRLPARRGLLDPRPAADPRRRGRRVRRAAAAAGRRRRRDTPTSPAGTPCSPRPTAW